MTIWVSFTAISAAALALSGCGEFMEGMSRGAASQQAYLARQADPFGTMLAELPAGPAPVAALPIDTFYRCTNESDRSSDYAFHQGEWYHKGWRDTIWTPIACGQGPHRLTSYAYTDTTCGFQGGVAWRVSMMTSRSGVMITEQKIDTHTLDYRSVVNGLGGTGERKSTAVCKELDAGTGRLVRDKTGWVRK